MEANVISTHDFLVVITVLIIIIIMKNLLR
jgi:hypothetical protein